ncbi:MAG TPA: hypothetical protein VMV93_00855, partial [Chloroflexota bacterium]|nr:hypothetical protein [Chloroflexota bacterium]
LSDGEINFAVLRIPSKDDPSKAEIGVHHFGFGVEDAQAMERKLAEMGNERLPDIPGNNQYFEIQMS